MGLWACHFAPFPYTTYTENGASLADYGVKPDKVVL